MSST
ncbi:hypothetical protein ECEC4436_3673, partial [Escherichia coli EC4436]|jgi:hypothetical protein